MKLNRCESKCGNDIKTVSTMFAHRDTLERGMLEEEPGVRSQESGVGQLAVTAFLGTAR